MQALDSRRVLAAIAVTTAADVVDENDGEISLREAISTANTNSEADVITFTGSAFATPAQIDLALGQFEILGPVEIQGPGQSDLTIGAGGNSRVFNIVSATGDVTISGMTLNQGATQGDNADVGGVVETTHNGGAVRVASSSPVTLRDLTIQNSQTFGARALGGGIFIGDGDVTVDGVTLTGNRVNGIFSKGGGLSIAGGTVTVINSDIATNFALGQSGGGAGISVESAATLSVQDSTIDSNQSTANDSGGAGIKSDASAVVIERSSITDNTTTQLDAVGGGIEINGGSLSILRSTIGDNLGSEGGGIHALSTTVDIRDSTFVGNQTNTPSANGGGIYADQTNLAIVNSTLSANETLSSSSAGGAIYLDGGSQAYLAHATITLNTATGGGGGIALGDSLSQLELFNSIVAANGGNNFAPDITSNFSPVQLTVASSLIGDAQGTGLTESQNQDADGNFIGDFLGGGVIDPLLDPLADNAGLTLTHAPQASSVAVDSANADLSLDRSGNVLAGDQRGLPFDRAENAPDMGALEIQPPQEVLVNWPNPENVLPGTVLGPTQLNAMFDVPGTIVYSPDAGTVLSAGEDQVLTATITPDDMQFYTTTVVTVEIDVVNPLDYGDAPESYGTRLNDDGPRHGTSALFLGVAIDAELNGVPSDAADADANDDGVVFPTPIIASASSTATIFVEASQAGKLDAWIDFDRDGLFDVTTDKLTPGSSIDVVAGINEILVTVPPGAVAGDTFARFRISTDGSLGPGGEAMTGEVEDYAITLVDPATTTDVTLNLTGVRTTLMADGDDLVVTIDGDEYFRAPAESIDVLSIDTDEFSNLFIIDQSNGISAFPSGGVTFDGGDRINTIQLVGEFDSLDFASGGNIRALNVDAIDLTQADAQVVRLDSASVRAMDDDQGGIAIVGGAEDLVGFADPDVWQMGDPQVVAGTFLNTIELNDPDNPSGTFVQVDFGSGWQNVANPSNVNNDDMVSALDALVIINELARNTYSDEATGELVDPSTVDPWPGIYFDQNNDGMATALDALRVINQLARIGGSGDGEGESMETAAWTQFDSSKDADGEDEESIRDAIFSLF